MDTDASEEFSPVKIGQANLVAACAEHIAKAESKSDYGAAKLGTAR